MEEVFTDAIQKKLKIRVTFFSKKDGMSVTRTCAPMDIGPHKRFPDKGDYYHVWDYDGSAGPHPSPLKEDQIENLEVTNENFNPEDFVTWETNWTIPRNWGSAS